MSSPPEPRTFEGWIEEDWPGGTRRPDVMAVLEPYREAVQYALDDFDDETQSWRDQCGRIYGWGFGPNDEGAVPHAVQKKVSEMMTREPVAVKGSASEPVDLDAWRAEAGAALATPFLGYSEAARTGWPRDAARVGVLCERVAALEARVAAWRKLAFTINTRRLSEGVAEGDEAAALEEAHHRAWAEVQRVDPEWRAASRKASK